MKRRLLMFHPIIAPYRIDMVNELAKHYEMTLCLSAYNLLNQKFDISKLYDERLNIKPQYLQEKKYNGRTCISRAVLDVIKSQEPDIIMVSEYKMTIWLAALYRALNHSHYKIISLVDDSMDMIIREKPVINRHALARKLAMPFLDEVTCVDKKVQEWYVHHHGKGIFFPIVSDDTIYRERLQRVLPISEKYVKKYNLQGKKVLLYVGRLYKDKNIPMAVEAFLQARVENSVFLIIGDGDEREYLMSQYGNEKSVMILGRYEGDALYAWYNVAQVFILPSIREPFGAVTNEALMAGCYVLLSDVAGSACLIEENINGNFISPMDKRGMTNEIKKSMDKSMPTQIPLMVKTNEMRKNFMEYMSDFIQAIDDL